MELSYFLIDAFINQSTYLAQFDTLNLNRQFVNSLVNRLILFFSGFLKVEFVIQWRITTVVAIMNALEPVTRKSNCITGMIFLELIFLISCSRHRTTKFPNSESPIFTTKFCSSYFCLIKSRTNSQQRHL